MHLNEMHEPTAENFSQVEINVRVNFHDAVHCRVSGTMCTDDSANAPEFFLHHAFIDKIWANWQEYSVEHMEVHFVNVSHNMTGTEYWPGQFVDTYELPDLRRPSTGNTVCVQYDDPTHPEYDEIMDRLRGMTRQQIMEVPRHAFVPVTPREMVFFNVSREEQRQARWNLRKELEPHNTIRGNAGLKTPVDRHIGFELASLPKTKKNKRDLRERKKNSMVSRWLSKASAFASPLVIRRNMMGD